MFLPQFFECSQLGVSTYIPAICYGMVKIGYTRWLDAGSTGRHANVVDVWLANDRLVIVVEWCCAVSVA